MNRNLYSRSGFTLVEVLVSLAAMAIAFVAVMLLQVSTLKIDAQGNREGRAMMLAEQKMEELRALALTSTGFSSIATGDDSSSLSSPDKPLFKRSWTITTVNSWRKDATVTVKWNERVTLRDGTRTNVARTAQLASILVYLEM